MHEEIDLQPLDQELGVPSAVTDDADLARLHDVPV